MAEKMEIEMYEQLTVTQRINKKREEEEERLLRRRYLAKVRFKAAVHKVIYNLYWLRDDVDIYEGDDVKRRVEQAMRATKDKTRMLLNITDKVLLHTPAENRTEAEKRYIYRKIGGLKCFKRYPNNVKQRLAAVTYFRYFAPNRVIVRQNQEAHAMYFIITGEVKVSVLIYDEVMQQTISIDVAVMKSGDMFGEVSLLHDINRTATCTSITHCEFLALMKKDFKNVLQESLQRQWDNVKAAMKSFDYFDDLDEQSRREGCIVAKMKSYNPTDTILGDGTGLTNFVYFVLSGQCQMLESLRIIRENVKGKNRYTLYDPFVSQSEEELDIDKKYFRNINQKRASEVSKKSGDTVTTTKSTESRDSKASSVFVTPNIEDLRKKSVEVDRAFLDVKTADSEIEFKKDEESAKFDESKMKSILVHTNADGLSFKESKRKKSVRMSTVEQHHTIHFMQVCLFHPGSTFGLGENMRDRRIVALTPVDCLLLPKVWLMQRNHANIWTRIQRYLEKKIPSKKMLFKEFVQQRRWKDYCDSVVNQIVSQQKTVNFTTIHDVPYSIRMAELLDI